MKIYWGKGDICSTYWIKVTKGRSGDDLESDLWGTGLGFIGKWNGGKFGSIWFLGHFILISTMSKTLPATFIFPFLCSTLEIVSLHVSCMCMCQTKAPQLICSPLLLRRCWSVKFANCTYCFLTYQDALTLNDTIADYNVGVIPL